MLRSLFALLLISLTIISHADETYVCLYGGNERIIHVSYPVPDSKVPCDVVYEKDNGQQVLWSAQNEEGYCEAKAIDFVEKQRGWGWDCSLMAAAEEVPANTNN